MANFIEKTLEPGEKVIFKGRLHWSYNFRYTAWGFLLILLSVAGMVVIAYTHYNDFNNNMLALFCACVVVCLVGIGLIGRSLPSRTTASSRRMVSSTSR